MLFGVVDAYTTSYKINLNKVVGFFSKALTFVITIYEIE